MCVLSFLHHKLEFLLVVLLQLFVCLDIALEHVVSVDCQFLDLAFLSFRLFLGLLGLWNYLQGMPLLDALFSALLPAISKMFVKMLRLLILHHPLQYSSS